MKKWSGILPVLCAIGLWSNSSTAAEDRDAASAGIGRTISPGEVTPTQEMWFYEQYQRQYHDPKEAVLEKARFRAAQRQWRLATRRWFGLSNSRPRWTTDPVHHDPSPGWYSNNYFYPWRWQAISYPLIVARSVRPETRMYRGD